MVNCSIRIWIGLVWGFQTLGFLGKTHFSFWGFNAFFLYPLLDLLCASYGAILYDFHMPFFSKNKNTAKNMLTKIYIHELTYLLQYYAIEKVKMISITVWSEPFQYAFTYVKYLEMLVCTE